MKLFGGHLPRPKRYGNLLWMRALRLMCERHPKRHDYDSVIEWLAFRFYRRGGRAAFTYIDAKK